MTHLTPTSSSAAPLSQQVARPDLVRALAVATEVAVLAGARIREEFHRPGGPRHEGRHHADVDVEAEHLIREALVTAFPDFRYVGEETGHRDGVPGAPTWYVDPNDGTAAFLEGYRGSAVSIALVVDDLPVLGVVFSPTAPDDAGDLITWAEGQPLRRNGAPVDRVPLQPVLSRGDVVLVSQAGDRHAQANLRLCAPARFRSVTSVAYRLALAAVGEGEAGVSLSGPVSWDFAAGHALLRAVGGDLVDQQGTPVRYGVGRASGRWVFGGHLEVGRALSRRAWGELEPRGPKKRTEEPTPVCGPLPPGRRHVEAGVLARAQGCLLGQFVGDALGALVEFEDAGAIAKRYPRGVRVLADGGTHGTIAGQPTDDSELALALARSLVAAERFEAASVARAYQAWLRSRPFDVGGTTRAGINGRHLLDSQANGSLMRVSPLAVFGARLDPGELARLVREDSALTHPHPICGDAVAVFSVAIAHAVRTGATARETYDAALRWAGVVGLERPVVKALEAAATAPPADFMAQQGWVLLALQNAFYQLLHAPSFEGGLVDTVGRGGDTDTNGAIAGALLGAVHGRDAVPLDWQRAVLSCRSVDGRHPRPPEYWPVDALTLAETLLALGGEAVTPRGALPRPA